MNLLGLRAWLGRVDRAEALEPFTRARHPLAAHAALELPAELVLTLPGLEHPWVDEGASNHMLDPVDPNDLARLRGSKLSTAGVVQVTPVK